MLRLLPLTSSEGLNQISTAFDELQAFNFRFKRV